jgi:hypothetical protein
VRHVSRSGLGVQAPKQPVLNNPLGGAGTGATRGNATSQGAQSASGNATSQGADGRGALPSPSHSRRPELGEGVIAGIVLAGVAVLAAAGYTALRILRHRRRAGNRDITLALEARPMNLPQAPSSKSTSHVCPSSV